MLGYVACRECLCLLDLLACAWYVRYANADDGA
jgi:hypothetical protein